MPDNAIGDSGAVYSFYALTSLNPIDSIYILDSNNQKTIILQISNFNCSPIYRGSGHYIGNEFINKVMMDNIEV
ncbi:MAG: hypothetical protein SGJ00_06485 [bacterium]|nr:hypothetical protein [bacterium]